MLTSNDHGKLVAQLKKVYSVDIQVLNRGTTSLLKFSLVPTHHPDGSAVTSEWLHKTIARHPKWADVEFVQCPRFIIPTNKKAGLAATVFMEVSDDRSSSVAKRLLQTDVLFHEVPRRAKPWSITIGAKQCGICLRWGHSSHRCSSKTAWCAICARNHETTMHKMAIQSDPNPPDVKCANCHGKHWAIDRNCPFYRARFNQQELAKLQKQRITRVREARLEREGSPRQRRDRGATTFLPNAWKASAQAIANQKVITA